MGGSAWVTLATNDSYSLGALVLANSLKQVGTSHQLVVLVTPGVTKSMREKLSAVFNLVKEVNILDSKDEANLRLLKRPELGVTFTKLHCWRLTQFDKCVFLDADTLVLRNCDELFDREELSAAPDVGWPDCFNSGVFVYRPSNETYENLVQFALEKGSFDGGDQGLLNLYFSDWATKDISKHLPFIYNLCSTACYSYLPAFKQFGSDTKIIHFIGSSKPWLQYFNTETRKVQPSSDLQHLEGILQHWWNIFCSLIHPQLTREMAPSTSDVTHTSISSCTSYDRPEPTSTNIIWDPWEEYDQKQTYVPKTPDTHITLDTHISPDTHSQKHDPHLDVSNFESTQIKPIESHNTNAYNVSHEHQHFSKPDHKDVIFYPSPSPPPQTFQKEDVIFYHSPPPNNVQESHPPPFIDDPPKSPPPPSEPPHTAPIPPPQNTPQLLTISAPKPAIPDPPVQSNESKAAAVCNETTLHTAPEDENCGGLAGAFAQLTLGAPRTAEQSALDDHLRRQGWEVGNIDYMGRDSFDNIWSKICETLSAGPAAEKTTEVTPSPTTEEQVTPTGQEAPPPPQDGSITPAETAKPVSETPQSIPLDQTSGTATAPQAQPVEKPAPQAQPVEKPAPEAPTCPLPAKPAETAAPEALQCPFKPKADTAQPATCPIPAKETATPDVATQAPVAPVKEQPPVATPPVTEQPPAAPIPVAEQPPVAAEQPKGAEQISAVVPPLAEQPPVATTPVAEQPPAVTSEKQPPSTAPVAEPPVPTPVTELPLAAAPVTEQPSAAAPVAEQPPATKPVTPQSPAPAPVSEQPPAIEPVKEQPPVAAPVTEQPPVAAPVTEQPPAAAPVTEQPQVAAPVTEQPPVAAPVPEQPPVAAPVTEQPPVAAPVTEQPPQVAAPVTEQPPVAAPVTEQPPVVAPVTEQPPAKAPVTEQPPTVEPSPKQPPTETPQTTQAPPPKTPSAPPQAAESVATPPAEVLPPTPAETPASEAKSGSEQKGASKSGAASASPTPPPRKSGGGGKKTKSKK